MQAARNKLKSLKDRLAETKKQAAETEGELAGIVGRAEELEGITEAKTAECNDLEDLLDAAESKLQGFTENFAKSEKSGEESLHAHKQLENRVAHDSKYGTQLEEELADLREKNAGVEAKLQEVISELTVLEETLDTNDERAETSDARVKALEVEATVVGNSLRSLEICAKESADRASSSDNAKLALETRYKEKDAEATEAETAAAELEGKSDELDESLKQARDKTDATTEELTSLIHEINEI